MHYASWLCIYIELLVDRFKKKKKNLFGYAKKNCNLSHAKLNFLPWTASFITFVQRVYFCFIPKLLKILRLLQFFFTYFIILSGDHLLVNGVAGDLHPAPKKNIIPKTKNFLWVYTKRADWGLTTNKLKNKNQWKFSHWKCVVIFWISVKPYPEWKWKDICT